MNKTALILGHMGLGDHLLCFGMIDNLSKSYQIDLLCKKNYKNTLKKLFLHIGNINFISIENDEEAIKYLINYKKFYDEIIKFGNFSDNFMKDCLFFDESFYKQVNIPYSERFKTLNIKHKSSLNIPKEKYAFIHDDERRNLNINQKYVNNNLNIIKPDIKVEFFDYIDIIKNAEEIHCIDSSFAILADFVESKGMLYLHRYARPNVLYPKYKKEWIVYD